MPDIIAEIQKVVKNILKDYQPLPLEARADRELERLERKVRESEK